MDEKKLQDAVRQIEMSEERKDRVITNVLEREEQRSSRAVRPLRAALIAACVCLMLVGTALAASPELRALIWGGFTPYAQDIDPEMEEASAVYDGIEIRLVSALADSRIARLVFEVRDLEGDRLARLADMEVPDTNGWNGLEWDAYAADHHVQCGVQAAENGKWELMSFDPDTGVARFQSRIILTENVEGFDCQTKIEAGAFDTGSSLFYERMLSYLKPNGPYGYLGETEYPDPEEIEYGWALSTHIKTMPIREIAVDSDVLVLSANGDVVYHVERVDVSELSATIQYRAEKTGEDTGAYELWHSAVLELSDGTKLPLIDVIEWDDANGHGSKWLNPDASFGTVTEDGEWYDGYMFSEPIVPDQVTGLWLEDVYIPLN